MRRVPANSLQPGMRVGHNIFNSRGETLISKGVVLNKGYIESLQRLNIPALYIIDDSLPDFYIGDVIEEKSRISTIKLVENIFSGSKSVKPRLDNAAINELRSATGGIIDQLIENHSLMVNLIDIRSVDDYLFSHSVNVCVLSLITGISLGYNRKKLVALAMGSLLHDMGKSLIPASILNKAGPLSCEEYDIIKQHPEYGYTILNNSKPGVGELAAIIALQHHERYNGEGYPQGLSGESIHELSQIVGLADVYDAMTADRVYRKAHPPFEVYEMLAASGNYLFDYKLVSAFLGNIAAYPAGSLVRLSSNEIAMVMETPKGFSLRPIVKILYDAGGGKLAEPLDLDLSRQNEKAIVQILP